jgi:hypothetical protein
LEINVIVSADGIACIILGPLLKPGNLQTVLAKGAVREGAQGREQLDAFAY